METIRDSVIKCLFDSVSDDDKLISGLNKIVEVNGKKAYPIIFHVLTHIQLEPDSAERFWHEIISHRKTMGKALERNINLRTAICDFFCSINKTLKNPVVVEIHIFEKKINALKYDSLTGLYSRDYFEGTLAREISRSGRYNTETSILFLDIDDFKKTNDVYGHLAGDLTLKVVSQIIRNEIRSVDIAARYGGEEILILLPETGKSDAQRLGERIRKKIEIKRVEYDGQQIRSTISGGIASFPIDGGSEIILLKNADKALYRAKNSGKNKIVLFSMEKRHYPRSDCNTKINVRKIDFHDSTEFKANTKNISSNGILFESMNSVNVNSRFQLELLFKDHDVPLDIIGTVVRTETLERKKYNIGISYIEIDNTVKNELSRLIPQLSE